MRGWHQAEQQKPREHTKYKNVKQTNKQFYVFSLLFFLSGKKKHSKKQNQLSANSRKLRRVGGKSKSPLLDVGDPAWRDDNARGFATSAARLFPGSMKASWRACRVRRGHVKPRKNLDGESLEKRHGGGVTNREKKVS